MIALAQVGLPLLGPSVRSDLVLSPQSLVLPAGPSQQTAGLLLLRYPFVRFRCSRAPERISDIVEDRDANGYPRGRGSRCGGSTVVPFLDLHVKCSSFQRGVEVWPNLRGHCTKYNDLWCARARHRSRRRSWKDVRSSCAPLSGLKAHSTVAACSRRPSMGKKQRLELSWKGCLHPGFTNCPGDSFLYPVDF